MFRFQKRIANPFPIPPEEEEQLSGRIVMQRGVLQHRHLRIEIGAGKLRALHRETGKLLWTHNITESGWWADPSRLHQGKVEERVLFFGDGLFFTSGPHLFALDWTDGRELWHLRLPLNEARVTPDPEGLLFVQSLHYFFLVDPADGSMLPLADLQAAGVPFTQWLSYGAVQGDVFVAADTEQKALVVLHKHDLSLRQLLPLPDDVLFSRELTPVFRNELLWLPDDQGTIHVFERLH